MIIEILMPALSPTMKEGNLAKWVKKEGDKVKPGEVIAEIETDKATMEVEAVDQGIIGKIMIEEGSEGVPVNSCIALLIENEEDKKQLETYKVKASTSSAATDNKPEVTKQELSKQNQTQTKDAAAQSNQSSSFIKASPLAKRIAKEEGLALNQIAGTGPHGRIVKDDVLKFNSRPKSEIGAIRRNPEEFTPIKNNNIRKVIAQRLLESKQNVPHFYLSCELNVSKMLELRTDINRIFAEEGREKKLDEKTITKISVNDLFIKVVAMSLKKVPEANSSWSNEAILIYNNIDISMAVAIDGGLITPIIKNADQKSLKQISEESKTLIKKARDGKLQPEEFQGGSFSISNLGMYGIDNFAAIVNPPQSCILAIARTVEKPIVEHGQIKIANMTNITLSCDHRSVDGSVGAEFLKALRHFIDNPAGLLL